MSARGPVVVLGAGSSGEHFVGALRRHDPEVEIAVVERALAGGECSYYACLPTKTLLRPLEVIAAAGREVFLSNCGSCHTLADAGTTGTVGPNLDSSSPPTELVVERVTNGMGVMPSFADTLSEQQIADVAAYVSSAAGS